jgi:sterol desaturase/sphingolipid hydroxylase (fatty acid hydroxylase superfamily)
MMDATVVDNEIAIRLGCFLGVFTLMAVWELLVPYRRLTTSKPRRWLYNLSMVSLNSILLRVIFPAAAVGMALITLERHWGLFNNVAMPLWLTIVASVIILDFVIYLQHVVFHAIPALWRLHMVHHTDLDIDVTTGNRFHPVEIILSMLIKIAAVSLIGPPVVAVVIFEVLLNATSMFNHSNIRIPGVIDRLLRLFVVTPDMHRVHHSVIKRETNSNYGFNLPWWDRLFGTYRDQPEKGHIDMIIGLEQYRDERQLSFPRLLLLPVTARLGTYPISRDDG